MEYITYQEAANRSGRALTTIQHAVGRALTKVPSTSTKGLLIKEQVDLFKGKRLSLSALSTSEHATWQTLHNQIYPSQANQPLQSQVQAPDMSTLVESILAQLSNPENVAAIGAGVAAALVVASQLGSKGVPQGNPFPVLTGNR